MSIRLRLTLLYSTILALTLLTFDIVLYAIQSRYTLNILNRDLDRNSARLSAGIARIYTRDDPSISRPGVRDPMRIVSGFGKQELYEWRVRDMVRVLGADGTTLEHPINDESVVLPLSDKGVQMIQQQVEPCVEIASIEGERWLIHSSPVLVDDQIVGIIQVARSLADRDRSLQALGGTLIVGSLLTTVIAFGIGWVLSEITLRPIHRITQTAQEIGAERDLSRRVAYDGPNDEVGQLATTFNTMLAQLQDAYQQVARSLQTQRNFVADVSHELRTPLTTVRGNLALLRREPPIREEEREDILTDMVDESERLIRLVNDLLTLARADAGRQVQQERVELGPLIKEMCHQAELLEPGRKIEHRARDMAVVADRDALKQVLLILLDNALKHTTGPVTVTANTQQHRVSVSVRDTGSGMDSEACEHIFDRFFRADTASRTPGFGLGLPIAKALIEAQGGTITVESEVDKGSVFTVTLLGDDT